jgi:hypothetical protein
VEKFVVNIEDKNGIRVLSNHKGFFDIELDAAAKGTVFVDTSFDYDISFIKMGPTGKTAEVEFFCDISESTTPVWNSIYKDILAGTYLYNKFFDIRDSFVGKTKIEVKNTNGSTVVYRMMLSFSIGSAMPFRRR